MLISGGMRHNSFVLRRNTSHAGTAASKTGTDWMPAAMT
jgi:hypothetical protein